MGFFNRVSDIIAANINDMLDKMEKPEKMMKQLVREMEAALVEAKGDVIKAVAHEKRVEKEIEAQKQNVREWHDRAVAAVKKERDDLARKALEFKKDVEDILAALEPELDAAREASAAIKRLMRALEAKCLEVKRKQAVIGAQLRAAETRKKAVGAAEPGKASALGEVARMEDKVAQIEAEAAAMAEIESDRQPAAEEFDQMEERERVDAELDEIKRQTGRGA